jgi:stearoyl-CoA desaturase (delta-9 desaturase)
MGESWHSNHHAFPSSARHGLYPGQVDLGFRFIRILEALGLARNVKLPSNLPPRPGITPLTRRAMTAVSREQNMLPTVQATDAGTC